MCTCRSSPTSSCWSRSRKISSRGLRNFCESDIKLFMDLKEPVWEERLKEICNEMSTGVKAAYDDFPQAKRCQQVLVDFAHAARLQLLREDEFINLVDSVSRDFGHDLLVSIIRGRQSKWVGVSQADYHTFWLQDSCSGCQISCKDEAGVVFRFSAPNRKAFRSWKSTAYVGFVLRNTVILGNATRKRWKAAVDAMSLAES